MSFLNKVAIVTGASSGIGAAVAIRLSSEGAQVAIVGRNKKKLETVSEKCEKNGKKPLTIIADVTNEEDIQKILSDTLKQYGKLNLLINNAGIGLITSLFAKNTMQVFDIIMSTNLRSVVYLTVLALPHLAETKGNIVNIASVGGIRACEGTGFAYSVSKAALDQFTRNIAHELGQQGIRVNSVNPGPVATDILVNMGLSKTEAEKLFGALRKNTVLQRISEPEEIADTILFLASDKAKGITGASFVVDNGRLAQG